MPTICASRVCQCTDLSEPVDNAGETFCSPSCAATVLAVRLGSARSSSFRDGFHLNVKLPSKCGCTHSGCLAP
jgi:hypothetical protein